MKAPDQVNEVPIKYSPSKQK